MIQFFLILLSFLAALAGVGQEIDEPCDVGRSLSLQRSGREAFDGRDFALAARRFEQAFHACPSQRGLLLESSQALAYAREFQPAIAAAQQFLEKEPASVPGRLALANAYFMAQQFPEALREAAQVLKLAPGQPTALKLKANAEYLLRKFGDAMDTLIELLERHPNDEEAAYMLGRIYYDQGRPDYAIGQFQRVLKINPRSYKAYDNLGLCYQARNETEMAMRHFLTAIKLVEKDHPEYDWPYANLANLLLETGDAQRAFGAASKAAERNPYSARNFYIGAKALCKLEKTELCVNWLQRSVALDPNYPEPLYLLARVYRDTGQKDKAQETLQKFQEVKAKSDKKSSATRP